MPIPHSPTANPAEPIRPASSSLVSALLLAAAAVWCLYWFVHAWSYWEDDAYIHLEFARSVAAGRGFAFNGHVVAGDTSPLWVVLLAGMHVLIPNWMVAGKVLTILGAAFGLSGTYSFARRLASSLGPGLPGASIFPAAMVALIVAYPYSCYWLFSGMEPFAAAGLAFFAVLAATQSQPSASCFLTGCLLAGLAPLLRPEMVFLTALLALPLLGQWIRLPSRPASPAKLALLSAGLLLLVIPLTLWSLYSLHAFGHLLPNTNAAKRSAPGDSVVHHLLAIYSFGFPLIVCGLVAIVVCLSRRPSAAWLSLKSAVASAFTGSSSPNSFPVAGWIFLLWPSIATLFYIADHTYVQTRYIMVTAPGLTIVILALVLQASRRAGSTLYLLALVWSVVISIVIARPLVRNKGIDCQTIQALALFLRSNIPPNAPVATYAIGEVVFLSEHPIVDTGGITRPGVIAYYNRNAPLSTIARWAQSQGAQYYIETHQPVPQAVKVYTYHSMFLGWSFHSTLYETSVPVFLWRLDPTAALHPATSTPAVP